MSEDNFVSDDYETIRNFKISYNTKRLHEEFKNKSPKNRNAPLYLFVDQIIRRYYKEKEKNKVLRSVKDEIISEITKNTNEIVSEYAINTTRETLNAVYQILASILTILTPEQKKQIKEKKHEIEVIKQDRAAKDIENLLKLFEPFDEKITLKEEKRGEKITEPETIPVAPMKQVEQTKQLAEQIFEQQKNNPSPEEETKESDDDDTDDEEEMRILEEARENEKKRKACEDQLDTLKDNAIVKIEVNLPENDGLVKAPDPTEEDREAVRQLKRDGIMSSPVSPNGKIVTDEDDDDSDYDDEDDEEI